MGEKFSIVLGCDHARFNLKQHLKKILIAFGYRIEDAGAFSKESVDYPDFAKRVGLSVSKSKNKKGILVCATGIGMSMAANKIPGIRAALVNDARTARLSRQHNDANILVLAGKPCEDVCAGTRNRLRQSEILVIF